MRKLRAPRKCLEGLREVCEVRGCRPSTPEQCLRSTPGSTGAVGKQKVKYSTIIGLFHLPPKSRLSGLFNGL